MVSSHGAVISGFDLNSAVIGLDGDRGTIVGEPVTLRVIIGGPTGLLDSLSKPLDEHVVSLSFSC